jgi:hypothetical protein
MKPTIPSLLLACLLAGAPALSRAQSPAAAPAAGSAERAQLANLGAQDASLLKQSAGERVIVEERVEDRPGWRGRRDGGYGYGYGAGALLLTVLLVTLLVLTVR